MGWEWSVGIALRLCCSLEGKMQTGWGGDEVVGVDGGIGCQLLGTLRR
jgi:hypothetical protein